MVFLGQELYLLNLSAAQLFKFKGTKVSPEKVKAIGSKISSNTIWTVLIMALTLHKIFSSS